MVSHNGIYTISGFDVLKEAFGDIGSAIKPAIDGLKGFFKSGNSAKAGSTALNVVLHIVAGALKLVAGAIKVAIAIIKTIVSVIKTAINIGKKVVSTISSTVSAIKSKMNSLKTSFTTIINSIKSKVTSTFNSIKTKMTSPINSAKNTITSAINKIKSVVNHAKLSLPHFKLPHFNVSGGKLPWGIGGVGVKPSISVSWYAKGGIFDQPSIIGVGEKGKEAVMPLEHNTGWIDTLANKLNARTGGDNSNRPLTVILQVDKQKLGKVTISSINNIIEQEGIIPLAI